MIRFRKFPKQVRAILFDWDGVISKTDKTIEAWQKAFAEYGISMTPEDWFIREGKSPDEIAKEIGSQKQLSPEICAHIVSNKDAFFSQISHGVADIYPDVVKTLGELRVRGYKLALVTGAKRKRLERSAGQILQLFDVVICADDADVPRRKPYPDPWFAALRRLDIHAGEAVGVENAVLGIQSLNAAGIFAVGLTTTLHSVVLIGADKIFSNISEILTIPPIDRSANLP
jgi:beta-phosphoglucomutase